MLDPDGMIMNPPFHFITRAVGDAYNMTGSVNLMSHKCMHLHMRKAQSVGDHGLKGVTV